MRIVLIRHGMTAGNLEKRYIGCRTDEPLCEEGKQQILEHTYPDADRVYVSPMKRCIMTAELIYPQQKLFINEKLKETDFGDFEGHNYQELSGNPQYQAWIDSGGMLPFPNGESREQCRARCLEGFLECVRQCQEQDIESIAMVIHGGTIMTIMEKYGDPAGEYYKWQIANGEYLTLDI